MDTNLAKPIDFKKTEKQFYGTKTTPEVVDVPEMKFFAVDGVGNPNTSQAYQNAVGALYALSYTVKMSKKNTPPLGYFDFVVPPLESLWYSKDGGVIEDILDKENFAWTALIRQPDFVTADFFENAKREVAEKKKLDLSNVYFKTYREGLCVQVLHIGAYDDEPKTVALLEDFVKTNGYKFDFSETRFHHEIYLNDPRKLPPEKLKTIIRYPIVMNNV